MQPQPDPVPGQGLHGLSPEETAPMGNERTMSDDELVELQAARSNVSLAHHAQGAGIPSTLGAITTDELSREGEDAYLRALERQDLIAAGVPATVAGAMSDEELAHSIAELNAAEEAERQAVEARNAERRAELEQQAASVQDVDLLQLNGFNALRGRIIGVVQGIESIPIEAIDATLAYAEAMLARAKLQPQRDENAIRIGEREVAALDAARRFRKQMSELEERILIRERLAVR